MESQMKKLNFLELKSTKLILHRKISCVDFCLLVVLIKTFKNTIIPAQMCHLQKNKKIKNLYFRLPEGGTNGLLKKIHPINPVG